MRIQSTEIQRWILFLVFVGILIATVWVTLYTYTLQAEAPDTEIPYLKLLLTSVVIEVAICLILVFKEQFLNSNQRSVNSNRTINYSLPNSAVSITAGNIHQFHGKDRTVVYPTNAYFDTCFNDEIVEENKSTWGQYLLANKNSLDAIDAQINTEITRLKKETEINAIEKPGRARIYPLGSTVRITNEKDQILLFASARLSTDLRSMLTESQLIDALRNFWTQVEQMRNIHHLVMPLIGAGLGRINKRVALAYILLTYQEVSATRSGKICDQLTIVVYDPDWDDWVHGLTTGLLGNQ